MINLFQKFKALKRSTFVFRFSLLSLLFLVLFYTFSFWVFKLNLVKAQDQVDIYFEPNIAVFPPDTTFSLTVDSKSEGIGFIRVKIYFDNTYFSLSQEIETTPLLASVIEKTGMNEANTNGQILLVLGLSAEQRQSPPSGVFELAKIPLELKTEETNIHSELAIDSQDIQIVSIDAQNLDFLTENADLLANIEVTPEITPTPTNSPLPTDTPTPTPTDTPSSPDPTTLSLSLINPPILGSQFSTDLQVSTSIPIVGIDAVVNFDPSKVEVVSIDDNKLLSGNTISSFDNSAGLIRISQIESQGFSYVGKGSVAAVNFLAKSVGTTDFDFEFAPNSKSESNVIAAASGQDILTPPQPLSIEIIDKASLKVKLTTSFEGTSGHQVAGIVESSDGFSNSFSTDTEGVSAPIELPAQFIGNTYEFFAKVTGFLRKKATLLVDSGENLVNFGSLLAGDMNDDGVVNNIDLSLMYGSWFGGGSADYNKDGIVNTFDYWILIQNFFKTND